MAERRPLVLIDGDLQELPSGDTLPGAESGLQNNYAATTAPAVTDDDGSGYDVGSRWIDVTNDKEYVCLDASTGAAIWTETTGAGSESSNNYLLARYEYDVAKSTTPSSSNYAIKGNIILAEKDIHFLGVNTYLSSGQTVKMMVAVVTHTDNESATITSILHDGTPVVISSKGYYNFYITNGIAMTNGTRYIIAFVRTDGTTTSIMGIPFDNSATSDINRNLSWRNSFRAEKLDFAVSDVITPFISSNAVRMLIYTVDNEFVDILTIGPAGADGEGVPTGGTSEQVLAKVDSTDFNTYWKTLPASGSTMVQTEITDISYSTVNDDFLGNVIRRMNNVSAQTITIEPSMTGGQPVTFIRVGSGAVSFAAGAGVTIHSAGGNLSIADQYGSATLIPDATTADTYYLIGNLTT